jgi:hypothetical protein
MLKKSFEKGTTVERLKVTQMTAFHRARNYVSGPEIPLLDKISGGRKFPGNSASSEFLAPYQRVAP